MFTDSLKRCKNKLFIKTQSLSLYVTPVILNWILKWFNRSKPAEKKQESNADKPTVENAQLIEVKKIDELGNIYVGVGKDNQGNLRYYVFEPALQPEDLSMLEKARNIIFEKFPMMSGSKLDTYNKMIEFIDNEFKKRKEVFNSEKLGYYLLRDLLGYGKIEPMMHDVDVEDVSCNGPGVPVYVWHRFYESIPSNVTFFTKDELEAFVLRLAYLSGKSISYSNPILDASLPEGHRIQITFGSDVSGRGTNFTIRKFKYDPITVVDLIRFGTMPAKLAAYFWYAIERNLSMLIAGGTASGKTTTLNALSVFIPDNDKVVTIEDTRELNLRRDNWVASVTREVMPGQTAQNIGLFDLLKASLRQRPDVIIVGEVRGEEAYTLLQAVATGHGGMSTIHAESVEAVIQRLSTKPMDVPKAFIATTLNMIVLQLKLKVGDRSQRRVIRVSELNGYDSNKDEINMVDSFVWDPKSDSMSFTGNSRIAELLENRFGIAKNAFMKEITMRETFLSWLAFKNVRQFEAVRDMLNRYRQNPEAMYYSSLVELNSATVS